MNQSFRSEDSSREGRERHRRQAPTHMNTKTPWLRPLMNPPSMGLPLKIQGLVAYVQVRLVSLYLTWYLICRLGKT